jgi:6-phosphogluconolactonase
MPRLYIYKSEKETCYAFAEWLTDMAKETLEKQERFTIAISGGDIPKPLYKIMATEYGDKINWSKVDIFLAENKCITYPDEQLNNAMETKVLVDNLPILKNQIHTINTKVAPEESARQYEELLRNHFNDKEKAFDLVILGLGEQGNLLSFFPNEDENNYRGNWVIPVYDKQEDIFKVSLTIAAINASAVKAFVVTGKRKEDAVLRVLKGKYDPEKNPAQLIVTNKKAVHWFLDEGAAGKLIKPSS